MCGEQVGTTRKPTIITLSGKAQHGKDASVLILNKIIEEHGKKALMINYADFLKYLAKQYLGWDGNKDEKGRTLLQQLGTEKVRHRFPDFWVDIVTGIVKVFENDFDYVLIGDCRFHNEINKWGQSGYEVISAHVERLNFDNGLTDEQKSHPSETALDDFNFTVKLRAETLVDLEIEIRNKMEELVR